MLKGFPALKSGGFLSRKPDLEDMMDVFWKGWARDFGEEISYPVVDIKEDKKNLVVSAELPGMEVKDLEVVLENNTLMLKGEKRKEIEEKDENYHRVERSYGSFCRHVPLPCPVRNDGIKAKYRDGVLTVTIPKADSGKSNSIKIEA